MNCWRRGSECKGLRWGWARALNKGHRSIKRKGLFRLGQVTGKLLHELLKRIEDFITGMLSSKLSQENHLPAKWKVSCRSVRVLWLNYISPNSRVEALPLNVPVLGERLFKKVIKVKWGHKGGTPLWQDRPGVHRRKGGEARSRHKEKEKAVGGHSEQAVTCVPRKRCLIRNQPCGHLDLGLSRSRIVRKLISVVSVTQSVVSC